MVVDPTGQPYKGRPSNTDGSGRNAALCEITGLGLATHGSCGSKPGSTASAQHINDCARPHADIGIDGRSAT
jgi:hypothetical protein